MPSIFSHVIFASAVGRAFFDAKQELKFWVLTAGCAMLPDADAVAFLFAVPYGSMLGHRGITHSITFAVLTGVIVAVAAFRTSKPYSTAVLAAYFAAVTLSHPLLDMLTNGGSGVALFAPFSGERYFWPWRPIEVSPIGLGFFSERGLEVVLNEVLWVWLPAGALLGASLIYRRVVGKNNH